VPEAASGITCHCPPPCIYSRPGALGLAGRCFTSRGRAWRPCAASAGPCLTSTLWRHLVRVVWCARAIAVMATVHHPCAGWPTLEKQHTSRSATSLDASIQGRWVATEKQRDLVTAVGGCYQCMQHTQCNASACCKCLCVVICLLCSSSCSAACAALCVVVVVAAAAACCVLLVLLMRPHHRSPLAAAAATGLLLPIPWPAAGA